MKSKDFEQGLGSDSQEKRSTKSSHIGEEPLSRQVSLPRRIRQFVSVMGAVVLPILSSNSTGYSEINTKPIPNPAKGIEYTLPESFQTSDKALTAFLTEKNLNSYDPCKDYVKIAGDTFGPEIDRACREKNPLEIRATDYIKDSAGNVVKQRAIINLNELWESTKDPVTHAFSDYKFVSKNTMESVTSMISSTDGNTIITGGEDIFRSAHTSLRISYDAGKIWNNITWPYPDSAPTIDLIRLTDTNYIGNNGNYEGGIGPFTITIDPITKNTAVKAASLISVQAVTPNIGSAHGLTIASLETSSNRVQMVSAGSLNLQTGLVLMDMDYITGIGTVNNITKTLIGGVPVYLNNLYGSGFYTDEQGHKHIKSSDPSNQLLYDFDTTNNPSTATRTYYGSVFNNNGIPNYMPDSLGVFTVGVFTNTLGNRETKIGGGYASILDGSPRAIFGDLDKSIAYDLGPNPTLIGYTSIVRQKSMRREKMNNISGYDLSIDNLGKAFIADGGVPIYTDRGLGDKVTARFKVFLPLVVK